MYIPNSRIDGNAWSVGMLLDARLFQNAHTFVSRRVGKIILFDNT